MLCILVCLLGADLTWAVLSSPGRWTALPCKANAVQGVQYRKISWYKVLGSEYRGLVLKNLRTNQTSVYRGANHSYALGEGYALLLPDSALSDCGTYQCTLWPPLGEYIQEGQYEYYPAGCVRPTEALPIIPLSSAVDVREHLAAWGLPAALLIFFIASATILALYQQRKNTKEKETI